MRVAVIPARGGSKRIPHKNIKPFCGKPMIVWSINAALESGCFDRVVVSTDDDAIAKMAKTHGAEVPFMRPAALADDFTGTIPVIAHAAKALEMPEDAALCCIYATAPFLQAGDIQRGLEILQNTGCDYAFSVTSYAFSIQRAIRITAENRTEMFTPGAFATRSQDLEEAYHDAGQFYWGRVAAWRAEIPIFSADSAPVILPRDRVQDIDTIEDWRRAELMFKAAGAG